MVQVLQLGKLVQSVQSLKQLMQKEFKSSLAFDIMSIGRQIQPFLDDFEKVKNELFKKFGAEDPQTRVMLVKEENNEIFNKEWNDLLKKEITVDFNKINRKDLKEVSIKPGLLMELEWMFTSDPETNAEETKVIE